MRLIKKTEVWDIDEWPWFMTREEIDETVKWKCSETEWWMNKGIWEEKSIVDGRIETKEIPDLELETRREEYLRLHKPEYTAGCYQPEKGIYIRRSFSLTHPAAIEFLKTEMRSLMESQINDLIPKEEIDKLTAELQKAFAELGELDEFSYGVQFLKHIFDINHEHNT